MTTRESGPDPREATKQQIRTLLAEFGQRVDKSNDMAELQTIVSGLNLLRSQIPSDKKATQEVAPGQSSATQETVTINFAQLWEQALEAARSIEGSGTAKRAALNQIFEKQFGSAPRWSSSFAILGPQGNPPEYLIFVDVKNIWKDHPTFLKMFDASRESARLVEPARIDAKIYNSVNGELARIDGSLFKAGKCE